MANIKFKSGALPDTRPKSKKDKDYEQKELVASIGQVNWTKKAKYNTYQVRKQNGSGSCVMQALEKERGIIAKQKYGDFIIFSANPSYQLRANPDISGSTIDDLTKATNYGGILESLSPSQSLTDSQMMKVKKESYFDDLAKPFGAKRIFIDYDIEAVASTIENTGKAVGLTIRFGKGEWFGNYQVKELLPESKWEYGHRVVAVDYTLNKDGVKCLVIEDSACEDGYPQRLVAESFFKARTYWKPNYILNFKTYDEVSEVKRPKFDGSVTSLQNCLKFEGLFPSNVDSTGFFGNVTKNALMAFQKRYNINPPAGVFGAITKAKLSEVYK